MSSRTYSAPTPFKMNVWFGEYSGKAKTGNETLDTFLNFMDSWDDDKEDCEETISEWEANYKLKDYGNLLVNTLSKGSLKVHYVNESQYSNVGENDICFFADSKEALEALCDDWKFDKTKILANQAVQQTL